MAAKVAVPRFELLTAVLSAGLFEARRCCAVSHCCEPSRALTRRCVPVGGHDDDYDVNR